MSISASAPKLRVTGLDEFDPIIAVFFHLAISEALKGDDSAAACLAQNLPDWRDRITLDTPDSEEKRGMSEGVAQDGLGDTGEPSLLLSETENR